jgi:hypothetical protein
MTFRMGELIHILLRDDDAMTSEQVENKFKQSWKATTPCPNVKKVYKVVESTSFLAPYDVYR